MARVRSILGYAEALDATCMRPHSRPCIMWALAAMIYLCCSRDETLSTPRKVRRGTCFSAIQSFIDFAMIVFMISLVPP